MKDYPQENEHKLTGIDGNELEVGDRVVLTLSNKTPELGFATVIGFPPHEIEYSRGHNNQRIPHDHYRVVVRRDLGRIAYISTYDTTVVRRLMYVKGQYTKDIRNS